MKAVVAVMPAMHWLRLGLNLAATLTAAWYSFSFGYSTGGPFMGTVAAVNGGAMASLLTSASFDWTARLWARMAPGVRSLSARSS